MSDGTAELEPLDETKVRPSHLVPEPSHPTPRAA